MNDMEVNERKIVGEVFSIGKDNPPIPGCTVSKAFGGEDSGIAYFSLAENTDISAEIYPYHKLLIVAEGSVEVYGNDGFSQKLRAGECILTETDVPVGMGTTEGSVYTEVCVGKESTMNEIIKAGEIFKLEDLVPYGEGKIVNMDVVHNDKMKLVVMAFDEGTGLSEHAAPGEAIIFALEGEAVIGYEGKDHAIRAGENFHFAKGGLHAVKATKRFKMALLLTLE